IPRDRFQLIGLPPLSGDRQLPILFKARQRAEQRIDSFLFDQPTDSQKMNLFAIVIDFTGHPFRYRHATANYVTLRWVGRTRDVEISMPFADARDKSHAA